MDLQLKDKSVIVTGGAKGIGLAITKAFLEEGARVCMVGTDEKTLHIRFLTELSSSTTNINGLFMNFYLPGR